MKQYVVDCDRCKLKDIRTNIVFGEGVLNPDIVFIGEAPGKNEDLSGRPFVGRSGRLLRKFINDARFTYRCYICNTVKCWPGPGNPDPPNECVEICKPMVLGQIKLLEPRLIVTLGKVALAWATEEPKDSIILRSNLGSVIKPKLLNGIPIMSIYHPSYVLRNEIYRKQFYWKQFKKIRKIITDMERLDEYHGKRRRK